LRQHTAHFLQRAIVKDHVGWNPLFLGQFPTTIAQGFPKGNIDI
jgi:hypothetical protein